MEGCTGEIVFACGKKYTEVPQKAIDGVSVGAKLLVWANDRKVNTPKGEHSCLSCPCKRKAKRKKDMTYHPDDIDAATDQATRAPTGIVIACAIAELKDSVK